MKATVITAILAHAATYARAAGSSSEDQTFRLDEVPNQSYEPADAPSEFIKIHAKYSSSLDDRIRKAIEINPALNSKFHSLVASAGQSSVAAYPAPFYDSEYVVPVKFGTPPQTVYLNLDTGSSDLWTMSSDTYPPHVNGHPLYHPENSTTSTKQGGTWVVRYGDGAGASGIVYKDVVQIGATSFAQQAIQSAIDVSYSIGTDPFSSGILGMAASSANTVRPTPQKTYIDNILSTLTQPLFTANLQRGRPGTYTFGSIDKSAYTGPIQYTPRRPAMPFWSFDIDGYVIGRRPKQKYGWNTIADTGTTLLLVPDYVVDDYYSQVPGATYDEETAMAIFPCDVIPPDFTFVIGSYKGRIPGLYINYARLNRTYCYGGLQSSAGLPFSIAGDILLKAQFVVFDIGNNRLGFANKDLGF